MKNINLLYYISGYIDGDGCFFVGKFKQKLIYVYEQSIQIVSVKRPVLNEFANEFGGSIRMKPFKPGHKDAFCWTIKGKYAAELAKQIQDCLVEKTYQCKLFCDFSKLLFHNKFRTVEPQIIEKRNETIIDLRKDMHLNNLITREDIKNAKKESLTITPSETDWPYLAGLIDSEGCFRIRKWKPANKPNHVYNIELEIGNTKLPIIPWLIKRFGGGIAFTDAKTKRRAVARWSLAASKLYEILPKIRPFLRSKKEVCDKLIEFQETILSNGGDRHSELFKALFEKRQEVRERIILEVHQLNHKGS